MVDLDSDPTKLLDIVQIGKQMLMTRGALTTFSVANDIAKYFAIIPAAFAGIYPELARLDAVTPSFDPLEVLAHRFVWSVGFLLLLLAGLPNTSPVPPAVADVVAGYVELAKNFEPADARYLENHTGHLMAVKESERRFLRDRLLGAGRDRILFAINKADLLSESERVEVERILNSRRVVGKEFLLGSSLVSLGIFICSVIIFIVTPRVGLGLDLRLRGKGVSTSGFSENIELGGHGLIRTNPQVVLRIEMPQKPPVALRFRGVSFDRYDKGRWSRSAMSRAMARRQPGTSCTPSAPAPSSGFTTQRRHKDSRWRGSVMPFE